ncbi:hemerythrin domain-containing protein [Cyclobacterium sp. 1_MG-2023]|uniref:hemerythrin domain-containing protein n=1 Tax=Cyclobacterium sp. 1_MG-2023 TaxID=3062681 RepID=UPI0026E118B2|nr:hemerythrin domain-containing protein [Cyclobacterium sp. 1_MG-2023]MDO6436652.1 hemerythrin domain-containing protein [Cyclobacterium sp. 1_MG-2023]
MGKPLKRHPAFVPVSRDHHFGLLLVWKIRQGREIGIAPDRLFNYVKYFYSTHMEPHFSLEESVIFSYMGKNDLLRKEVESQHRDLRDAYKELREFKKDDLLNKLNEFCQMVEAHIRFEERKLFQYMQVELLNKELEEMEEKVAAIHKPVTEDWEDKFWVK